MKKIIIADLDAWVIRCIQEYPLLFGNRFYVIDHIFNDYGTGYDWEENGYLSFWDDPREENWLTMTFDEYHKKENERFPSRDYAFNYHHYHLQRNRALNAHKLARVFKPLRERGITKDFSEFIHLSKQYSPILNFPNNVAEEYWLDMINMMIYVLSTGKYEDEIRHAFDRLVNKIIYKNKQNVQRLP